VAANEKTILLMSSLTQASSSQANSPLHSVLSETQSAKKNMGM
jgi:hypothetical protein